MRAYLARSIASLMLIAITPSFGWGSTVGVASASPGMQTTAPMPYQGTASNEVAKPPRHCITGADQVVQCFDTEADALRVASGGRIQLAPGQTARSLPYEEVFGSDDSPNTVQAIMYEHTNYGGATLTVYNSGCSIWNNMPGGWNDVTSSVWSGACGITLYDYPNKDLAGKSVCIGPPGTSYVGSNMNDRASSWSIP